MLGVTKTGLTIDEPPHLGAAWMYSRGLEGNIEHPVLIKAINAVLFSTIFASQETSEIEQYKVGWDLLSRSNGLLILQSSRAIYAFCFILCLVFLVWLWHKKIIDFYALVTILIFAGLSPVILPHAALITFDAISAMVAIIFLFLSYYIVKKSLSDADTPNWIWNWWIAWFVIGILTKYSLIYLILPACTVIGLLVFIRRAQTKIYIGYFFKLIVITLVCIGVLYSYCFRNTEFTVPDKIKNESLVTQVLTIYNESPKFIQMLTKPYLMYTKGAYATFLRSKETTSQFIYGKEYEGNFGGMFAKVYPYKENILVLLSILILIITAIWLWLSKSQKFRSELVAYLPIIIFIILFATTAFSSKLLIGIRHMYPVIGVVYLLVALMVQYVLQNYNGLIRKIIITILGIVTLLQLFQLGSGISSTNLLWTKQSWVLAGDSAIIWGQDSEVALYYLQKNNLMLKGLESQWDVSLTWAPLTLDQYSKLYNFGHSLSTFENNLLVSDKVFISDKQNILVDARVLYPYARQTNDPLMAENAISGYTLKKKFGETVFWYTKN